MVQANQIDIKIRTVLQSHTPLANQAMTLAPESDLYHAGMNSLSSVNVMLSLEETFNIEFPDHMLNKKVFGSIAALKDAVLELRNMHEIN